MQRNRRLTCNTPNEIISKYLLHLLYSIPDLNQSRKIWKQREIDYADTILEHTEKVHIAASIFAENNLDYNSAMLQNKSIVHDYPKGSLKLENIFVEEHYMRQICNNLPPSIGCYALGLWTDFKIQKTPEDEIIHQLNVLDSVVSALDIEQRSAYHYLMVSDIYSQAENQLEHSTFIRIFDYLMQKEFAEIENFTQYICLLKLDGNIDKFRHEAKYALTPNKIQQILFKNIN